MTQIMLDRVAGRESVAAGSAPVLPRSALKSGSPGGRRADRPITRPLRTGRPARGSGRAAGPILRPVEACPAPALTRRAVARARGCQLPEPDAELGPAAVAGIAAGWRLTERGVAVVLVVGLMIMVAALTVVGLTAIRVTGPSYQPSVSASLPR